MNRIVLRITVSMLFLPFFTQGMEKANLSSNDVNEKNYKPWATLWINSYQQKISELKMELKEKETLWEKTQDALRNQEDELEQLAEQTRRLHNIEQKKLTLYKNHNYLEKTTKDQKEFDKTHGWEKAKLEWNDSSNKWHLLNEKTDILLAESNKLVDDANSIKGKISSLYDSQNPIKQASKKLSSFKNFLDKNYWPRTEFFTLIQKEQEKQKQEKQEIISLYLPLSLLSNKKSIKHF